jgi:hypothetical protein
MRAHHCRLEGVAGIKDQGADADDVKAESAGEVCFCY